jgi:hypothetical protein
MIRELVYVLRPTRFRTVVAGFLGVLVAAACDNSNDPLGNNEVTDSPAAVSQDSSVAVIGSNGPAFSTVSYTGLPFGPFGLWNTATTVSWGPAPFTGSHNYTDPNGIVLQISAARSKHQRLLLAMSGGASSKYLTNGKFDLNKWKNRMNLFKTTAIKNAVAAGVADGTIIGNTVMDEPETKQWGGNVTKPMLDAMGTYTKAIFPTLPVGVNHGPTGYYQWRGSERYRVLDYVLNQYAWWVTTGNVAAWRDKVLAQARLDGVTPAFSLNIINGGVQDRTGSYDCPNTGGKGSRFPNCRMTSTQVRDWSKALGVYGCAMTLWKYDASFLSKAANLDAIRDVAATLNSKARRSCKRS